MGQGHNEVSIEMVGVSGGHSPVVGSSISTIVACSAAAPHSDLTTSPLRDVSLFCYISPTIVINF